MHGAAANGNGHSYEPIDWENRAHRPRLPMRRPFALKVHMLHSGRLRLRFSWDDACYASGDANTVDVVEDADTIAVELGTA